MINIKSSEILKNYRKNQGLTVAKFAEMLGVSQVFLTHLEHDKRKISESLFERLEGFLSKEELDSLKETEKMKDLPDEIIKKIVSLEKENNNLKEQYSQFNLNEKIGNIIKEKRKKNNYSLDDVKVILKKDYDINLDASNISRYENGTVKNMNPKFLMALCKINDIDYIDIFKQIGYIDMNLKEKQITNSKESQNEKLSIVLKKLRESRNITIIKLAEISGIANGTIGDIERGKSNGSKKTLEKISNALKLNPIEKDKLFSAYLGRTINNSLVKENFSRYEKALNETLAFFYDEKSTEEEKEKFMLVIKEVFSISKK